MKLFKIVCFSFLLFGAARLSKGAEVKTAMLEGTIISRNPATNTVTVQQSAVAGMMGVVTAYAFPKALDPYYGSNPHSFYLFLRLRGRGSAMHAAMQAMPPM